MGAGRSCGYALILYSKRRKFTADKSGSPISSASSSGITTHCASPLEGRERVSSEAVDNGAAARVGLKRYVDKDEPQCKIAAASRNTTMLAVVLCCVPRERVLVSLDWGAGSGANLAGRSGPT